MLMSFSSAFLSALVLLCNVCSAYTLYAEEYIQVSTGDPTLCEHLALVADTPSVAPVVDPVDAALCIQEQTENDTTAKNVEQEQHAPEQIVQRQPLQPLTAETDSTAIATPQPTTPTEGTVTTDTPAPQDSTTIGTALPQATAPGAFDMITNLPSDWWRWSKEAFTAENIPLIAGISIMTAMTIITDYETWQPFKKEYERNEFFRFMCDRGVDMGDGKFQFGLAGAFALYGFAFSDDRALRTASQTVEVILACGGVVQLLKHITGRESPFVATTRTGRWDFFPNQIEYAKHVPHYDAFPSGHVATALATLTVIAENYPEATWIRYIGYPAVGLIAVGLVGQSIHWWSDYPLSIVLGYSFGMLVSHPPSDDAMQTTVQWTKPSLYMGSLSDGTPTFGLSWRL